MLLTLTTTAVPATDLGYLLAKNPARCQSFDLAHGRAHVFYPQADPERCTAALMLELDPIALARGGRGLTSEGSGIGQYVNDRPYVASSFLCVAIAQVFGSALNGNSRDRPALAATRIPLEATLPVLPCRGGEGLLRRLFEPLGYEVVAERLPLDLAFPEWGESPYFSLALKIDGRLSDLLSHLYVLLPVLDNDKHYWVGQDEIDKLLARGQGWLPDHPEREVIVSRYLKRQHRLVREGLERLAEEESDEPEALAMTPAEDAGAQAKKTTLNDRRLEAVAAAIRSTAAKTVIDLGCGEGKLLSILSSERLFERLVGMDVSPRALEIAGMRLNQGRPGFRQDRRIELFQGGLTYRDSRLAGFDLACAVEVIEHLDPPRLPAFERVVFEYARPATVIITTPNAEHNALFDTLATGSFRHRDHRFEWTRSEFRRWVERVEGLFGYVAELRSIGDEDPALGPPTQMALFRRCN